MVTDFHKETIEFTKNLWWYDAISFTQKLLTILI